MPSFDRRPLIASLAGAAAVALAPSVRAQPAAPAALTVDGLKNMVTNMGYDCKLWPSEKGFTFQSSGSYNLSIDVSLNSTEDGALLYVFLGKYDPEEFSKLKLADLLLSNDSWRSYFSLESSQGSYTLYIQYNLPSASVAPAKIRLVIDNFQKHLVEAAMVWDKSKWQ